MGSYREFLLILLLFVVVSVGTSYEVEEEEKWGEGLFLLHDSKEIVRTDAGVMRVVSKGGFGGGGVSIFQSPMHIGFITMEPNTLFIPQYMNAQLTLFVRRGKVFIHFLCFVLIVLV